jgi:hypothetical protein
VLVRTVGVHNENLVAGELVARGLENQALSVGRPVGFGVLPAKGQLLDIVEVRGLRKQARGNENKKDGSMQTSIVAQPLRDLKWHETPAPAKSTRV